MDIYLSRALPVAAGAAPRTLQLTYHEAEWGRAEGRPYHVRIVAGSPEAPDQVHTVRFEHIDQASEHFYLEERLYGLAAPPILEAMIREAERHEDLLTAFQTDLFVHDRMAVEKAAPGTELLWLLGSTHTEVLPLFQGKEPVIITHWLRHTDQLPEGERPRTYHIVLTAPGEGRLAEISHADAHALAAQRARVPAAA